MTEEQPRTGLFEGGDAPKRLEHRFPIMYGRRKLHRLQTLSHITSVAAEKNVPAVQAHAQRLMSGRMTVGRDADDAAIAEEIVFAIDQSKIMSQVVVTWIERVARTLVGVLPGLPFTSLDDEPRIRNRDIATRVIEMKMRVHQVFDACGVDIEGCQAMCHIVLGPEIGNEEPRQATDPRLRIGLQVGVQPAIE